MNSTRHRAFTAGAVALSATLATGIGVQLSGYGVPVALLLACCLSCMATLSSLLFRVIGAWSTTTHRCTRPGCDFHVSLTHADSAENRRWQEIAAHHPHRSH
ncbi:hypothetical protein ACFWCA_05890 [Streptomyces phaeochromogenes]|uniref:hypothetical protein n=1 Tax=Streptomyces phaeochromogenes TaxID=1923 RepID=UPI00369AA7AD